MDRIFGKNYTGTPLTDFSTVHLTTLFILLIGNLLFLFILAKIRNQKIRDLFRVLLGISGLIHFTSFLVWSIWVGYFTFQDSLPLHLCDITALLACFMLFTRNRLLFEVTYFCGIGGALMALLTPDITQSFPHFVFINFFLAHSTIITSTLWMIVIEKYEITLHSLVKTVIVTNAYMLVIAVFNLLTGSNYLYICRKPGNHSLFDFLGPWPWYVLSLEMVGTVIFLILYSPFALKVWLRTPPKPTSFGG